MVFVAVTGMFVGINVLSAGALLAALGGLELVAPALAEEPWVTYPVGVAALALALLISARLIAGRRPGRGLA